MTVCSHWHRPSWAAVFTFILGASACAAEPPRVPPDLTQGPLVDRKLTYNLGATGLRGWIYTRPGNFFERQQGRTTTASRQILVTHVGVNSPAEGVVKVDDVKNWLTQKAIAEAVASGRFDVDRKTKTTEELLAALGDWSPVTSSWAAEELAKRPEGTELIARLIVMSEGSDARQRQGAAEALGYIKSVG